MSGGLEPFRKDAPYSKTTVPWDRTEIAIKRLLEDYGAVGIQWTLYRGKNTLRFIVEKKVKGVLKEIHAAVQPPAVETMDRKGNPKRNKNQEYRMLYYWLKSKLEAIKWGMVSFEDEFLSKILYIGKDGRETTIGEVILPMIAEDKLLALVLDRDLNAAHNILKRCTVGHTEINACGVVPRGIMVKQEAHTYS
jgi:hypothetical protein